MPPICAGTFIEVLAQVTLVLVLLADATRIDLAMVGRQFGIPARLLGLGLPVAVLLGGLLARAMFPELGQAEAFLIAAMVAPTDAALGQAVVSDRRVPVRIRQALDVVAGLAAAAAGVSGSTSGVGRAIADIVVGVAVGAAVGLVGGWMVRSSSERPGLEGTPRQLATLAVPAMAYAITGLTAGKGFTAAPLEARYGRWSESMAEGPEMEEVDEMRVARRGGLSPTWSGWRQNRRSDR